ncbi:hypothetical protein H4S04_000139 [Coemansia sp. S16]|nr:hypothetical protein GGI14_000211 [Coemansia sp. S680]KAJ2054249.1 hypothetical protein H4S04_000139 [Coemansia sp. S16]KAJ2063503.1 hypothetical protein GGI08_002523 [Coemansia sp. S2]KAJ2068677.1 hypothetical protein GGH13_004814 [Coemansia sp. S155-1]KAJ2075770.1 hypothetical protein GGI09_008563 [Coemansia sp. S100]KAJ2096346.1 hypothetical protein GGI16_004890 [Coemansia sp. S142-1]KAJ2327875.1 hypothetical protein GGH92_009973 [Coemansia sp. RSA 2673]
MSHSSNDSADYIVVSPFMRILNHSLAGITESRRIAVRINKQTMDVDYEPTNLWFKRAATTVLFGITIATFLYRRKRLERVGGLVSLTGASRPIMSGIAWTTGIAAVLNSRPITPESPE